MDTDVRMFLSSSTRAIFDIVSTAFAARPGASPWFCVQSLPVRPLRIKPKARAGRTRVTLLHRDFLFSP
jgi:hypothetical protein